MESLISVLVPCRNEEERIRPCLESILAFEQPAGATMEVLVLDGQSTDRTPAMVDEIAVREPRVRRIENPRRISAGAMNVGLKHARGRFIMRLDAHSIYPRDYLARCYETALRTNADNVGGLVITQPGGTSYQAGVVQALTTHKFGVGDSGFRTGAQEGPADTVPFGFFRRDVFERLGAFDERLVRAQDYEFNRRVLHRGGKVWLNPLIQAQYFNQKLLGAFYRKQLFLEAPYNAYLWYVAPYAFAPRHLVTGIFAAGVLVGAALAMVAKWLAIVYGGVLALYAVLAIASALQQAVRYRRASYVLVLPACFFGFHFLHGLGVLGGLFRLLTRTAPVQRELA